MGLGRIDQQTIDIIEMRRHERLADPAISKLKILDIVETFFLTDIHVWIFTCPLSLLPHPNNLST